MVRKSRLEESLKNKLINNPLVVSKLKINLLGYFHSDKIISSGKIKEILLEKKFTDSVKEAREVSLELDGYIFDYFGLFGNKLEFIELSSRILPKEKKYHVYAFNSGSNYQTFSK